MLNIGVNDGHTISGPGSGAIGKIIESKATREVGNLVRQLIKERGHNPINCTIDYASSANNALDLIVKQADRQDLDWFISIHFNAGGGNGVEVYTYQGRQYQDAIDVCNNIAALGFINRGVRSGTGLYVVSKTKAKSMLIEICFVDTSDADRYLKVGAKAIAKAIADGICGYVPIVEKPKFPLPLKMIDDAASFNLENNKPKVVKEFFKEQLITARSEVNEFYTLDINGVEAFIPKKATSNRGGI